MTTATIQQQANRQKAAVERAFDRARDFYETVKGQLANARKAKQTLRVIELEPEEKLATDALNKAAQEYESTFGVRAPLSIEPQLKPGTVAAIRAANAEFRSIDDVVICCEREINRLRPEIARLEKALAALGPVVISTAADHPDAERVLDAIYPERVQLRAQNIENLTMRARTNVELQVSLADLRERIEKVVTEWEAARAKRDGTLADLSGR